MNDKQCKCNKSKVVNDLLKRISNLEFDVEDKQREIERLDNILNKLEKWLEENRKYIDEYDGVLTELRKLKGDGSNE